MPDIEGQVTRREVLKAGLLGAAGLTVLPAVLAACSGSTATPSGGGGLSGKVTVGSNLSDAVPKKALADVVTAFTTANPGVTVTVNTVDHTTFQNQISNYLAGHARRRRYLVLRLPHARLRRSEPLHRDRRCLGRPDGQALHRRIQDRLHGRRRQAVLGAVRHLRLGCLLPQERVEGEGIHDPDDPRPSSRPSPRRCRRTASSRSALATRTAGRRWATSTSSTCARTGTSSTST